MRGWSGEDEDSEDDEDAVAKEVMVDRYKPRFGEQALAPIKVSGVQPICPSCYFEARRSVNQALPIKLWGP